jgi:two-component system, LytTR family, response regulator LytT
MRIVIIEDEGIAAQRLEKMILEALPDAKIEAIIDSIEDTVKWFQSNTHPDLIFLDVELSDGISFEIFNQVKTDSPIIFTTAYNGYALKAFELHCIDYLIKPISNEKLKHSLEKIEKYKHLFSAGGIEKQLGELMAAFNQKTDTYRSRFLVTKSDGYLPVFVKDIAYFFTENEKVYLVTFAGEKHSIDYTIENLQQELEPDKFWRANRAFIISAESIVKVHNYFNYKIKLQLKPLSEKDVVVSRARVSEFKKWFAL